MNESIEYLVAAILVVLLVSLTVSTLIPMALQRTSYLSESHLQTEAEKIANQLLLSPGDPADWGVTANSSSDIKAIGLALDGGEPYELDINKLIRLCESSINEITEKEQIDLENVSKLLGIYGKYGLSIRLTPVLNVSVQQISNDIYEVTVTTHEDLPVANANITAIRVTTYVNHTRGKTIVTYIEDDAEATTDYNGKATLTFSQLQEEEIGSLIIIYVDFYGIRSVFSYIDEEQEELYGVIIGNALYVGHLNETELEDTNSSKTKKGKPKNPGGGAIFPYPAALLVTPTGLEKTMLFEGKLLPITPPGSARPYYKFELNELENEAVMIVFTIKNRGRYRVVVARRSYNELNLDLSPLASSLVARGAHIRRIVKVSGFLYYFDLTLWRIVEED